MSADASPSSTVEHGGFTLSGPGADDALKAIQADEKAKAAPKGKAGPDPEPEKLKGKAAISQAASELGKQGGKATAKARAAAAEAEKDEPALEEKAKAAPAAEEDDDEDAADLDKHPRAKARVEEATRKAKAAREDLQREKDRADRAERERDEARRTAPKAPEREPERRAEPERPSDEPKLEAYLQKHAGAAGGEAKAISEWVGDRDKWRDGQAEERQQVRAYAERVGKVEMDLRASLVAAKDADEEFWSKVEPIAAELHASHTIDQSKVRPAGVNWLADELHLDPKNAPRILSYLADNRDDYDVIKGYHSPREVTRAVAIIVAHLGDATAGESSPSERRVSKPESSKAPPPVRPVTGAPGTASDSYGPKDGEDFDVWFRRTKGRKR